MIPYGLPLIYATATFERDLPLKETEPMIRFFAEKIWSASRKESRIARTVVLKLTTSEFNILTRSHTPASPPSSCEELTNIALSLRERVDLGSQQRFRLVGVALSNFCEPDEKEDTPPQPAVFEQLQILAEDSYTLIGGCGDRNVRLADGMGMLSTQG